MGRTRDCRIENCHVVEHAHEVDILLSERFDEIVILHAGDRKHRRLIELGVIQAGEQVRAAGPGSRKAYAQLARPLGICARHECGGLFMAHLHESNAVLACAQSFHDAVDAVAGQAKYDLHAPIHQCVDENIGCVHGGVTLRSSVRL